MITGIIGCGNIGTELALFMDKRKDFELKYLFDIDKDNSDNLTKKLKNSNPKFASFDSLIKNSELTIESANKEAVKKILKNKNLDKGNKKLLVMSTSGLFENITSLKKTKNCDIYLPSGAIAGLDAIKSVSGKISSLTLTTTKNPKGIANAPFILKNNINLKKIKNKKIIFQGKLKEAVVGFPKNINVAATLFLASKFNNIKIKIIADPKTKTNTHEIVCKGNFGNLTLIAENLPSKNPKTSYLAILSAIQVLKNINNKVKIGS